MHFAGIARRASSSRALTAYYLSVPNSSLSFIVSGEPPSSFSSPNRFLSLPFGFPVASHNQREWLLRPQSSMVLTATFCSGVNLANANPSEDVKEIYDQMLYSIKEKRSAPPNSLLWSLIEKCKSKDDVKLLFDALYNLRIFRLSNLRIHDNFNCNLCREVTKACVRVGAIDFGKKALWKHNVYGLSPTIGSANHLLSYAKSHKDSQLMVDTMKLIKGNDLPMQPSTADIVFSICYDTDNWELISKYSKRFLKAGVKLRKEAFGSWMQLAAKRGDVESLWKIEELRSVIYKEHNLHSGFACAKGLLLEQKPDLAAAMIQVLNENLSDSKRPEITVELQTLVSEWPLEVIKHQKEQDRKALAAALKSGIPAMINSLISMGVDATSVNTDSLNQTEALL